MDRSDCLVVIHSSLLDLGKRYLLEGDQLEVGRGAGNGIVLESDSVSRRHAAILQRGGRWWVCDLGSANGTYVNHQPVHEHPLLKGDLIKIADTIFKFLSGSDVEAQYHQEIYRMSVLDGLTEVYNRRYALEALEREAARARRRGRPLAVLLFDIDHFKLINDTYGHLAGDKILRDLARGVPPRVGPEGIVGRYGGEEFLVVLRETDGARALILAEQIRADVEEHVFEFDRVRVPVTVSVGVAALEDEAPDAELASLIRSADEKLYRAKCWGRNRIAG